MENNTYNWYQQLIKPDWAPPGWVFGPVWTILYAIIAVSFGTIFYKVAKKELPAKLALPFALNLVFNFAFTPIQFGLKNNFLASIDILFILATTIWSLAAAWRHLKWVSIANIPYLLWVSFATILQLTITWLNRGS